MIPLKANIPTKTFPIISISFIVVNILIFSWQRLTFDVAECAVIFKYYGLIPIEFFTSLIENHELLPYNVLTVFTSMFLHGGLFHVIGNILYLWIFGNNIEDALGRGRFFVFYFLSGIAAAIFQLLSDPSSSIPMIGASGAVSGILGAYLVLYPRARIKTMFFIFIFIKIVDIPAFFLLTLWFFMQILFSGGDGVAYHAHIGGFIFGLLTGRLLSRNNTRKMKNTERFT